MIALKDMRWSLKVVATAFASIAFCIVATKYVPSFYSSKQTDGSYPQLRKYQYEDVPRVLLVGSSLTFRLSDSYFRPMKITNIAFGGGSPLTGLEIVASYPKLPELILVETNVMIWPDDPDIVRRFSYSGTETFSVVRPIQTVATYLEQRSSGQPRAVDAELLLRSAPANYDNALYVERAVAQWSGDQFDAQIKAHVGKLGALVDGLRSRGARVYFFEMPYPRALEESRVAVFTRAAVRERFNNPEDWLNPGYAASELRYRDHAHLDERSALVVARAMRDAISAKLR